MVDVQAELPDGAVVRVRKMCPANTKAAAVKLEAALRVNLAGAGSKRASPTVAEFAEEFLAYQKTAVRPGTYANYAATFRNVVLPEIGDLPLPRVDSRVLAKLRVTMSERLSRSTANTHFAHLHRSLKLAEAWGVLDKAPPVERHKTQAGSTDFLSFSEADALAARAQAVGELWGTYVLLSLRTGLRVGEALGLLWSDVDLGARKLIVQRNWDQKHGYGAPKSGKTREVPLAKDLVDALASFRAATGGPVLARDRVPGSSGRPGPVRPSSVVRALDAATRALGMRRVNPHLLRHTFASHAVMRGVPLRVVQAWLGHASIQQTMRYAHLSEGVHADFIDRLSDQVAV
jgi:integrase